MIVAFWLVFIIDMMEENKCGFCHTGEEHESVCGTLHKDKIDGKAVCAHQKCMQYSANWVKFKTDSFGGFQKQAVMKEIERGSTLICAICKADKSKKHKNGATSVCAWEFCRKTFHYLCVSMNPRTVVKQYRVAEEKGVILCSVFCCQEHENRYRKNLIAYGIVGKNGSSDEGGDSQDEEKDNSDTDNEPPAKVPKVSFSQLKDKLSKKEEGESGISSPGMTTKEVLSETQLNIFQRKNSTLDTKENGNDDSFMTATSGHDSGGDDTDDFNTSNSGSEMLENGHLIRNIAEDELKMEDDSGPVTEKEIKEVDEELTSGEMFELSLEDRKHNKAYRPPKDACIFDGRLITLEKKDISILETVCVKEIGKGGFGNVYSSSDYSDDSIPKGFGMHVAVKKIKALNMENEDYIRSIRREMITSRIMHPFVLPLLAVVDRLQENLEFWFVSPLCKNGDLHAAIKKGNVITKEITYVKILLHIALAIQYIHTAVPKVRDVILHKDISSKNVVLDDAFNARLIDFGLAREKDDVTTNANGNVYYSHPKFGEEDATESWDYYSLGVIIREMLTGLRPQGIGSTFLKKIKADKFKKILEDLKHKKECVWSTSGRDIQLNSIAEKCLQQSDWKVKEFDENVVQEIKEIWKKFNQSMILDVTKDHAKCHICMINPKARETSMTKKHAAHCRQKIEVCIACEKNCFLNPIKCYCGTELQPEIGSKYGALLVAGNDLKNTSVAEALTKDILELKKLITSRAPRIIGISENKVRVVAPTKPGEPENLWPKVKEYIDIFSEDKDIHTLLIYISCHGAENKGSGDAQNNCFEFGSESIAMTNFQEELERLVNVDKLIVVLDRCHPSRIKFQGGRKFIQINACKENEKADITDEGSIFTKYLLQGLKANTEGKRCSNNCQSCNDYWAKRTDFITVHSLYDYVKNHMKNVSPTIGFELEGDSSNIAFYTDDQVLIEFEDCTGKTKKDVPLEYLQEMKQLESKLFKMFEKEARVNKVKILRETYRKENGGLEECDTLEKVMSAWVHRQPLKIEFKPL